MLKKTREEKRLIAAFVIALIMAEACMTPPIVRNFYFLRLPSRIYAGVILAWGFLVKRRMGNPHVRRLLLTAAGLMISLFVLRVIRWDYFEGNPRVWELLWYAYYLCFTAVPLCSFLAALCVGKTDGSVQRQSGEKTDGSVQRRSEGKADGVVQRRKADNAGPPAAACALWLPWGVLAGAILTNPLHQRFLVRPESVTGAYQYGVIYYVCVFWCLALGVLAFFVIFRHCRVAASRKKWYLPALGMGFGMVLMVLYFVFGGSPHIGAFKLYHIHEAFCLTFILPFELMLQTGILPNNSHYELFFRQGSIGAAILDKEGKPAYASMGYLSENGNENVRFREWDIRGGRVVWREDLSVIRAKEEELRRVTERLEDENELIRQENDIRSERIGYETKNRLYDKIAGAVREQAIQIRESLKGEPEEAELLERLPRVAMLGAYVKRMGNLMLIADEKGEVSTLELGNAMRESFEMMKLWDKVGVLRMKGEARVPAQLAVLSYGLFETVLENALPEATGVVVNLQVQSQEGAAARSVPQGSPQGNDQAVPQGASRENGQAALQITLRIKTDGSAIPVPEDWRRQELEACGAKLTITHEDEGWITVLCAHAPIPAGKEAP